jgi:hypothetical protein
MYDTIEVNSTQNYSWISNDIKLIWYLMERKCFCIEKPGIKYESHLILSNLYLKALLVCLRYYTYTRTYIYTCIQTLTLLRLCTFLHMNVCRFVPFAH